MKQNKKTVGQLKSEMVAAPIRLDIGCGQNKREGFLGVDIISFQGVDVVMDVGKDKWKWKNNSVEEIHASHFVEHLTPQERCHFVNECFRVLKVGGKCTVIVPHWASCRAYGDPTHKWQPVSEFWFYYLSKEWRLGNKEKGIMANAPHTDSQYLKWGFNCDFEVTWGYSMRQDVTERNQEYQQFAMANYKEAITDMIATLTRK